MVVYETQARCPWGDRACVRSAWLPHVEPAADQYCFAQHTPSELDSTAFFLRLALESGVQQHDRRSHTFVTAIGIECDVRARDRRSVRTDWRVHGHAHGRDCGCAQRRGDGEEGARKLEVRATC